MQQQHMHYLKGFWTSDKLFWCNVIIFLIKIQVYDSNAHFSITFLTGNVFSVLHYNKRILYIQYASMFIIPSMASGEFQVLIIDNYGVAAEYLF